MDLKKISVLINLIFDPFTLKNIPQQKQIKNKTKNTHKHKQT